MSEVRRVTLEQALQIARAAVDGPVSVRDMGLLDAAVNRPHASMFGQDAYPDLCHKAAALLHSLVTNHPLVDGNKRLGWLATWVFLAKNGTKLSADDDAIYDLVLSIADGSIQEIPEIALSLRTLGRHGS